MRQDATIVEQLIIGCAIAHGKAKEPKFEKTVNDGAMAMDPARAARTKAGICQIGGADAAIGTGSTRTIMGTTREERADNPGTTMVIRAISPV